MYTPDTLILNGAYRIERELGRGAFGIVYLATHQRLQVERAIKVLHADTPAVGSTVFNIYRDRFTLEAQLAARLHHAHVIQVYDFHEDQGTLLCVMEYAPGRSLANVLEQAQLRGAPLPVEQVVSWLREAALGLQALHDRLDAVHRDVKPANLLLDAEGRIKVADLGLAQIAGSNLSQRSLVGSVSADHPGTPNYASPEHRFGSQPLTPAADVYGLGCVAFELLTGQRWKRVQLRVAGARDLRADAPDWLDALLRRMLAEELPRTQAELQNPALRYAEMSGVLEALEAAYEAARRAERERQEEQMRTAAARKAEEERRAAALQAEQEEAARWAAQGNTALGGKDYQKAISDYTRAIELAPDNAVYSFSRGLGFLNAANYKHPAGDYAKAIADFTRAIELAPDNVEYSQMRGICYNTAANAKHPAGDYAKAIADDTRAIELAPNNANCYNNRGLSYTSAALNKHLEGDYAKAIADNTRAIELAPDNAVYSFSRGLSYHNAASYKHPAGDYAKAIADFTRAIELAPNTADYYYLRALSLWFKDENLKALADVQRAMALEPGNNKYSELADKIRKKIAGSR